jgi:patatin-like phospholipase/acyl hydrolase
MGSSAAPTYFPSYKRQVDAAVMCNNPALAAISALMSERAAQPKTPKQIHILSLGTGRLSQFIDGEQHDWGMIKWAPYLLQIMVPTHALRLSSSGLVLVLVLH